LTVITWDSRTLYEAPSTGVCAITGKYETGRFFKKSGERIFVGDGAQAEAVEDYVSFVTALRTVGQFKRGYPKAVWTAERLTRKKG
jgi:hypothetical protein